MNNDYFTSHIHYIISFLNLPFPEIRHKLRYNPIYLVEYIEESKSKRFIESPMSTAKTYMVCSFNEYLVCDLVELYVKETSDVKKFLSEHTPDYDFIKSRWCLHGCYMETKEPEGLEDSVCLFFYR